MKVEIPPLDRHVLLSFLKDEVQPLVAVEHYAAGAVARLIAQLEAPPPQEKLE